MRTFPKRRRAKKHVANINHVPHESVLTTSALCSWTRSPQQPAPGVLEPLPWLCLPPVGWCVSLATCCKSSRLPCCFPSFLSLLHLFLVSQRCQCPPMCHRKLLCCLSLPRSHRQLSPSKSWRSIMFTTCDSAHIKDEKIPGERRSCGSGLRATWQVADSARQEGRKVLKRRHASNGAKKGGKPTLRTSNTKHQPAALICHLDFMFF